MFTALPACFTQPMESRNPLALMVRLLQLELVLGRHLALLGAALLGVIIAGLVTPAVVAVYAMRTDQPWWMAAGASGFTLAGVAAVLHTVPKILGPEGVSGVIKERRATVEAILERLDALCAVKRYSAARPNPPARKTTTAASTSANGGTGEHAT